MGACSTTIKFITASTLLITAFYAPALAGGFDRGGINIDQLFDTNRFSVDAQATVVNPRRKQLNVQRGVNVAADAVTAGTAAQAATAAALAGGAGALAAAGAGAAAAANPGPVIAALPAAAQAQLAAAIAPATDSQINGSVSFIVPRYGYKQNIGENLDCLLQYSEPFGADQANGAGNALSASSVEFFINTQDYGATCSYGFAGNETKFGDSRISIIGGLSYQELQGFLSRQSFLDFANAGFVNLAGSALAPIVAGGVATSTGVPAGAVSVSPTNTLGLGTFSVEGDAVGWRAGLAYEIPEIALRAAVIYHSSYDYDLSGVQNNTGFGIAAGSANATANISVATEIPQALELKFQSGIAEGTLAFANFKWQEWSELQSIPIVGGITATATAGGNAIPTTLAFEPLYRDGYTITGGLGTQLTEKLSGLASLTWDRGTSTTVGSQSDTWTLSGGLNYEAADNMELRLGGAVGLLTGGQSTGAGTIDAANNVFFEFDEDILLAVSGGIKIKF